MRGMRRSPPSFLLDKEGEYPITLSLTPSPRSETDEGLPRMGGVATSLCPHTDRETTRSCPMGSS